MIKFRCWYCNKYHSAPEQRIGQQITCSCKYPLRIPRRSGGSCKVRRPVDWVVEVVVHAGGGGLLGLGLAVLILSQLRLGDGERSVGLPGGKYLIVGLTAAGFFIGLFGGERGINWIGRMIREWEER